MIYHEGKRAPVVSGLCDVRNAHVRMLEMFLGVTAFREHVRVVGMRGLDVLARSRTLPAPVWERIEPRVAAHEHRLTELVDAAAHVAMLAIYRRMFCAYIVSVIDSFGNFNRKLATMHHGVAAEGCAIEARVVTEEQAVKSSTRVLVSAVGSLL